jgi:predicted MPP superfamily phosphohydrolase
VSGERADLIAITGDFLTLRTQRDWSPVIRFIERLRAAEGVYACLGNHDVEVADELTASLRAGGVTVLRDEVAWLSERDGRHPVAIGGLEWRAGRDAQQGYGRAFAGICAAAGGDGPAIALCHQPSAFRSVPPAFGGIMLAGHLHGGQIGVSWGHGGVSILRLFGKYDQGLFARGRAWLYSHRGTGVYGFPLRVGVPAEIAVLTLAPAADAGQGGGAW